MGNAALRELAVIEPIDLAELAGDRIAIDAHNWLYRYLTITVRFTNADIYTTDDGEEVANLIAVCQGVAKLLEAELEPVFVFDGEPSALKADEIERRRNERKQREREREAARERGDMIEAARLDSQSQRLTETIRSTSHTLLEYLDIETLIAPAEGEAQAAHMARQGVVDCVGTEDYDALLFGAPITIRQLTSSDDAERMDLAKTLVSLDLTYEQLVDAAILIGTDYNDGISGIGPKTAVAELHEHGDLWSVLEARELAIEYADRIRDLFLEPRVRDVEVKSGPIRPDIEQARSFIIDEWGVDESAISRPLERIEHATRQTGLDSFH